MTLAGVMLLGNTEEALTGITLADPVTWNDYILYAPTYYLQAVGLIIAHSIAHPALLAQGATFAGSLLLVLTAHEAGHYLACRYYAVNATLPFFIPAPPLFLAGTFGAFIKIKSAIPSRRALFDIGVAGPLAGFACLLPLAVTALLIARPAAPQLATPEAGMFVVFNDPLLLQILAGALGIDLTGIEGNPFYFAVWIGLLVTSLNLLPVGQLDGGHAVYAVFGVHVHKWLGRLAVIAVLACGLLGWQWHGAPGGLIYTLLLLIMLRMRHPHTEDETEPLGFRRTLMATLVLAVLILSFLPFPISVV